MQQTPTLCSVSSRRERELDVLRGASVKARAQLRSLELQSAALVAQSELLSEDPDCLHSDSSQTDISHEDGSEVLDVGVWRDARGYRNLDPDRSRRGRGCERASRSRALVGDGDMSKRGWQIFRGVWNVLDAAYAGSILHDIENKSEPMQGDQRRRRTLWRSLPGRLQRTVLLIQREVHSRDDLGVPLGKVQEDWIFGVTTHWGALRQNTHIDTPQRGAVSVMHSLSVRHFLLRDFEHDWLELRLEVGDVILFRGDVCHAGAPGAHKRPSYAIYVPTGYGRPNHQTCPSCILKSRCC